MMGKDRNFGWLLILVGMVAALAVVLTVVWVAAPSEEPVARSYNTACYQALGGDKWVCASGGEFEFQSGATLDVQSGASVSLPDLTISGAPEITGTLTAEDVVVTDTLTVGGAATLNDAVEITGTLTADDVVVTDTLSVGGDITLENDETVSNSTDGVVQVSGFFAFTAADVVTVADGSTITPLASYQPITSTAAVTNAVIADGSVAGQLVVIVNQNAGDDITILESGSNLESGGDITLTGGAYDAVVLMWDSARWIRLSFEDN